MTAKSIATTVRTVAAGALAAALIAGAACLPAHAAEDAPQPIVVAGAARERVLSEVDAVLAAEAILGIPGAYVTRVDVIPVEFSGSPCLKVTMDETLHGGVTWHVLLSSVDGRVMNWWCP